MASKYDPIALANEAAQFAVSAFGQHYLERLEASVARARRDAENLSYNDSYRAHKSTYAASKQEEIDYFKTATDIKNSPDLMTRLKAKLKKEESPDV